MVIGDLKDVLFWTSETLWRDVDARVKMLVVLELDMSNSINPTRHFACSSAEISAFCVWN